MRFSKIDGCACCMMDMHTREARALGKSERGLRALSAWCGAPFYTDRRACGKLRKGPGATEMPRGNSTELTVATT
ncbi:carboxymuconolactone decarboxylase family protein [Methylocaldum marinum]|uniref:carboxymuconolactone decarboxylase family protein n=1 Tax=Methylocaldum marinum TaxID=1432792 RepID=UPI0038CBF6F9